MCPYTHWIYVAFFLSQQSNIYFFPIAIAVFFIFIVIYCISLKFIKYWYWSFSKNTNAKQQQKCLRNKWNIINVSFWIFCVFAVKGNCFAISQSLLTMMIQIYKINCCYYHIIHMQQWMVKKEKKQPSKKIDIKPEKRRKRTVS